MKTLKDTLTDSRKVQETLNLTTSCDMADIDKERLAVIEKTNITILLKNFKGKDYELGSIETKEGQFIAGIIFCDNKGIYDCYEKATWDATLKNFS